ncbi:MAG: pyridoxamine 5'-phosphate oxidase family protein [Mediterranea sp.]|jgi:nitroimidazol reductase NimA-like FMN-containing flavoprotein (pyridoxamine 5'-phosphate oxidase superfamily)|nr:pyridoxamine 5'-phosphate oxidase family protein [Mediterranea sp.]
MKTIIIEDRGQIESIISRCTTCFVGFTDLEGNPYVIPMSFGYEAGVIYFHSGTESSIFAMLKRNPHVCVTFCPEGELVWRDEQVACSYSMRSDSVICRGTVTLVDEMEAKRHALDILMRNYTDRSFHYSDPAVRNIIVWTVNVDRMTAKSFGLRPIRKDFINNRKEG